MRKTEAEAEAMRDDRADGQNTWAMRADQRTVVLIDETADPPSA